MFPASPNALVRLPPEKVLNVLADWAIERWTRWFPWGGGADLCDYVPCAWVSEFEDEAVDLDDLDEEQAEARGLSIGHDPRWPGTVLDTEEVKSKDAYGQWKVIPVEVRVEYERMGGVFSGAYDRKRGPSGTVEIALNFAQDEDARRALRPGHWEDQSATLRHIRAILAHELAHAFGPHKVRLDPLEDPRQPHIAGLPWERDKWEKQYMTGPDEIDAFSRELFQRMKDAWLYLDDSWHGQSYPFELQRKIMQEYPHMHTFVHALDDKKRRLVVADVGRAMRLFVKRQLRRRKLGR